jgi:hypothetical protein
MVRKNKIYIYLLIWIINYSLFGGVFSMVLEDKIAVLDSQFEVLEKELFGLIRENEDISHTQSIKNLIQAMDDLANCRAHLRGSLLLLVVNRKEAEDGKRNS